MPISAVIYTVTCGYGIARLLERCDTQERYNDTPDLATFGRMLEAELTPQLTLF